MYKENEFDWNFRTTIIATAVAAESIGAIARKGGDVMRSSDYSVNEPSVLTVIHRGVPITIARG